MGTPNTPIECKFTGLDHYCFPDGYAPETVVARYEGMIKSVWWGVGDIEPAVFVMTLDWIDENTYWGGINDATLRWTQNGYLGRFSFLKLPEGTAGGGFIADGGCPIAIPGSVTSSQEFDEGVFSLKIREECFEGPHPWDVGDSVVVPRGNKVFSEIVPYDGDKYFTRYARHRDGMNIKIYTD